MGCRLPTEAQSYQWWADAVLVLHAVVVFFVIGGQIFILLGWLRHWVWTRHFLFRALHLAIVGFVTLESWLRVACPLTTLENILRIRARGQGYEDSFIGYWLQQLLFYSAPAWVFSLIYTVFAALVVISFVAYPPRRYNSRAN
jgi:hypothetical protein